MTVYELYKLCEEQVEKGNGNKSVVVPDDEEGNGYHDLFYPFLTDVDTVRDAIDFTNSWNHITENDANNIVILG